MPVPEPRTSSPLTAAPDAPVVKLAAKVAHELNNPLDAVLRLVSLAQRKAQSGDYADLDRHLNDAQFGLQRMAEILRELMEIGRQTYEPRPAELLPLEELVTHATRTIRLQAEQKHVAVQIHLPPGLPLRCDIRLTQVLANLLKNAVDAAPEDSAVHLTASTTPGQLKITVQDAGPGLDPALLPRLFTPFVTTKPRGKGHGLGLAISRELTLALGGTLTLENAASPDGGCLSTILLPLA